jgi:putative tricarboxylic transport membrane protein
MEATRTAVRSLFRVGSVVAAGLWVLAAGQATPAAAQWKPDKPIQFVVPYAPGGGSDVFARTMVNIIKEENLCPVPIIVNNQAGGGSTIGTTSVAQAKGNALMLHTFISGQVAAPLTAGKAAATYRDLTMICGLANDDQFIVVKADSPLKTVEEVIAKAKEKDGAMTIGGTATGQEDQMCNRLMERAAGIKLRYVPFNSGGECITALLGGHVEMIWANPSEFVPQYDAKMVRPVVVARESRSDGFKDVPTFKEKGFNVTFKFFRGIAAPPGIPPEAASYYEGMFKKMFESPRFKSEYLDKYMLAPAWLSSKEFAAMVAESETTFKGILTELGLIK